uniref:Mediator complex subunit Med12 LCEWAV-domain domain-containing protein n=1 Tax=Phlebotomus papatasi TaxID=29031 RepID=A0A1B0EXI4_PHLPP
MHLSAELQSPGFVTCFTTLHNPSNTAEVCSGIGTDSTVSRHFLYTKHFPLSQDGDVASQHDCNQRYILLFGVGKERDEKKHAVKKMSKEICKLFSKKFSIDVAEGGKVKKHSRSEFNFESTTNKCQSMSYFDQHFVTWQCAVTVQEMLNSFALGNSNYLPVQEHDVLREKQNHIEQLLAEKDLDRQDAEIQSMMYQKDINEKEKDMGRWVNLIRRRSMRIADLRREFRGWQGAHERHCILHDVLLQ